VKRLKDMLSSTARTMDAFKHPRVNIAWQDLDFVYRKVHNPSPDIKGPIVGKKLEDLLEDKAQAAQLTAQKQQIVETGKPHNAQIKIVLGGKEHIFDLSIEPTYDEHGEIDGLISTTIDVTDLVMAREQIKEANGRLVKLLDQALRGERAPHRRRA
jgi:PAS fold